jgi:FtsH-binding integral membrane protein
MEEKTNSFWKDALKPGLILSLVLIIFSVAVYIFDLITISLFAGVLIGLVSLVLYIIVMFFLIKSYRTDKLSGIMKYGKAFGFAVIIGLYSSVILTTYNYTFTNFIDPDYEKNITLKMQEMTEQYMLDQGVPDEVIEAQMKKTEKQLEKSTLRKTVTSFAGNLVFALIAALIASAFAKKNEDPYQEAMQDLEE